MHEPLQDFDFKSSQYERPQCGWVCGRAADGAPCSIGPNRKGECRTVTTCTPARVGDRYECTRPVPQGGRCKEGPLPDGSCCQKDESCQPKRNLMNRRRLAVLWVSVLAFGYCLWSFGGSTPSDAISPGEITFQHRSSVTECATCHAAANGGVAEWVKCAFDSETAIADSKKCLECHHELGKDAFAAHGFSRARLVSLTDSADDKGGHSVPLRLRLAKFSKLAATDHLNRKLACATCHHEHRGKGFDLKQMSNDQCSTCHKRQFRDFGHGHPEFTDFPYPRRSRIYFDHARHMQKHFPETASTPAGAKKNIRFECANCHSSADSGRRMLTHSFEKSCSSCHESQVVDRDLRGVAFLQLPTLDIGALDENKVIVGQWPSVGTGKRSAELPPMMKLLLRSDPEYREAMKVLGSIDLRDLDPAAPEQKKSIAQLFWSIKRLFHGVRLNGERELRDRLGTRAGSVLQLKPSIAPSIVAAGQRWFPNLVDEMKHLAENNHDKITNSVVATGQFAQEAMEPNLDGGWYFRDTDFAIRYRPTGHSDPVLKSLLETGANAWYRNRVNRDQRHPWDDLFLTLANPTASGHAGSNGPVASGRCLLCHSADVSPTGGIRINWKSGPQSAINRSLTKFSHAPHVKTLGSQGCAECHQFEKTSPDTFFRPEFFARSATSKSWLVQTECKTTCTSGFAPTRRAVCVKCHTGRAVGDSCLKCHNYHGHALKP